jgi:hypothetical protein
MATKIDGPHAIAHNKIMIIDEEIVITGSFNFTEAAGEKNEVSGELGCRMGFSDSILQSKKGNGSGLFGI